MSPISIGVLAVSMSIDAFVAALGRGASGPRPSFGQVLRTGAIFGAVEMLAPLIGWAAGLAASRHLAAVDHWIAFALLGAVGAHMIFQALSRDAGAPRRAAGLWATVVTALATSLDAMAVGVSLAFLEVNIIVIAAAIGAATLVMSSTGLLAGRLLGARFGRGAEILGGLALFALGALIVTEHLAA